VAFSELKCLILSPMSVRNETPSIFVVSGNGFHVILCHKLAFIERRGGIKWFVGAVYTAFHNENTSFKGQILLQENHDGSDKEVALPPHHFSPSHARSRLR